MYSFIEGMPFSIDIPVNCLKVLFVGLIWYHKLWVERLKESTLKDKINGWVFTLLVSWAVLTPLSCSSRLALVEEKLAKCVQLLEERSDV